MMNSYSLIDSVNSFCTSETSSGGGSPLPSKIALPIWQERALEVIRASISKSSILEQQERWDRSLSQLTQLVEQQSPFNDIDAELNKIFSQPSDFSGLEASVYSVLEGLYKDKAPILQVIKDLRESAAYLSPKKGNFRIHQLSEKLSSAFVLHLQPFQLTAAEEARIQSKMLGMMGCAAYRFAQGHARAVHQIKRCHLGRGIILTRPKW